MRTLAAAGVAVTVSLGTALKAFDGSAIAAACLFLGGLGANLVSYQTAQKDMEARLNSLAAREDGGALESRWTPWTRWFNYAAGVALFLGGVFLAIFIAKAT